MATFDPWQQVYCLSQQSNLIGSYGPKTGTADSLATWLGGQLTTFYTTYNDQMGTWSTVWGPVVYQDTADGSQVADNVMYVAADEQRSTFVICIAGKGTQYTDPNQKDSSGNLMYPGPVNRTLTWWYQAMYQHLNAYDVLFGVQSVSPQKPASGS